MKFDFISKHKKAIKRGMCVVVSFVMLSEFVPIPLVDEIKDMGGLHLPILTSHAANTTITNLTELQAYVDNYSASNASDVITFAFQNEVHIPATFAGIGTDAAPFQGTLKIDNVSNDNGGASQYLNLEAPLFKAISDQVSIEAVSGGTCTLYLKVEAHASGDYTTPLFAQTVYGQGGAADWRIKVNNTLNRSCLIGEMTKNAADESASDPNVSLTCTFPANSSPEIKGTGDLGVICNKITKGSLTLNLPNGAEASKIITSSGNVGGLAGTMASGTSLTLNSSLAYSSSREIKTSSGYAGGIVGRCEGTITLSPSVTYNDSNYGTIEGTSGAGGLFGYYGTSNNVTFDLSKFTIISKQGDGNDPGQGFKSTQSTGKTGGIIGELVNSGSASTITIDGKVSDISSVPPNINVSLMGNYGGGLIGYYNTATLDNVLEIKDVCCHSEGSMSKKYGGLIGSAASVSSCGAYLDISNIKVISTAHPISGTIQYKATNTTSAGIIESATNSFLDIHGKVIIDCSTPENGSINAGIVHTSSGGVVRFAGETNLSSLKTSGDSVGLIAVNRDNTLIYALGDGSSGSGWTYIRPAAGDASVDDIKSWGQVVRYVSTTSAENSQTLEGASVVTVSGHTVTLEDAVAAMNTSADFAKTALNIKLNTASDGSDFGALKFKSGATYKSATLLNNPLSLEADIDLSKSGITGLTKDNGTNVAYTNTFSGNNHTIKLATGEAYGYTGNTSTPASITAGAANRMTGAIHTHSHNGLFAKLGTSTVQNLTIDGCINASGTNTGGLTAELNGATVSLTNIDTKSTFSISAAGGINIGFVIGNVSGNTPETLNIGTDCKIEGTATVKVKDSNIGMIGAVDDKNVTITADGIELAATIEYNAAGGASIGGFIGKASSGATGRKFNLNNINIKGMTVNTTNSSGGINSPAGALLGGKWYDTNVYFKDSTHNESTDKGVTVTSGTIALSGSGNTYAGGLVAEATGYWQVNKITITDMSVTGATSALGLLVMRGKDGKSGTSGLYLEITSPTAYSITSVTAPGSGVEVYDEIMAYSKSVVAETVNGTATGRYLPDESNGQAIISIRTTGNRLSMTSSNINSYVPSTTLGSQHNPFARYYYNLDYLLRNASTAGEKLMLWSVYQYAASNIKTNSAVSTANTKGFSNYSSLPTAAANTTELDCDLSYLSYYPVDISSATSLDKYKVTFHNAEMEAAHGGTYSTKGLKNNVVSQHYLMHAGLFKDVSSSLTVTDMKLIGTISSHEASNGVTAGSGAIICGEAHGSTNSIINVTLNGITLGGIKVNGTSGIDALLIKKIGSYIDVSVSDVIVSSTEPYNYEDTEDSNKKKTRVAAKYLLGDADGASMSIVFDKMALDSRKAGNSSRLYNPDAASTATEQPEKAAYQLNQAYHTYSSIFDDATFLHSLHYLSGTGSSAKYNYQLDEDWKIPTGKTLPPHYVTYAYEIKNTLENLDDDNISLQNHYIDQADGNYTSPESNEAVAAYDFNSNSFQPHVAVAYDSTEDYHEVAVNIISLDLETGCGTYNDPYVVDGNTLAVVAKILDGNISDNFKLFIDNDFTGSNLDFSKTCTNKTGHTQYKYNGTNFVKVSGDSTKSSYNVTEVQQYLAGAYYYIEENATLSSKYVGLGGNTKETAFRGVIVGADNVTITNASDKPLVNVSNGCVVKNLTISVTNTSISKSADSVESFAFGNTATQYYGGVIGKIMGGDNIIDAVQVRYSSNISVSGTYKQNVPVGGYIGVVVNGSVFFRNMENVNTTNNSKTITVNNNSTTVLGMNYHVKYGGTGADIQGEVTIDQSNGKETFSSLYVNPIIGRVINGFAVNETDDDYHFSEDGKYVDLTPSNGRTRGTASDLVSLKNNRKNFSIPDFNSTSKLSVTSGEIMANDAQALYILSLILQTNMGSAQTADGNYKTSYDSGYDSDASGKSLYRATHLATYSGVGKLSAEYASDHGSPPAEPGDEPVYQEDEYETETEEEFAERHSAWETAKDAWDTWNAANTKYIEWQTALSAWNTAYSSDFDLTANEKVNSAKEIPYLIYNYTNDSAGKYLARTLSYSKFNLNLNATHTTYYLPDSFRGIGYIPNSGVCLTIKNLNGNGNTIDINTYFRAYAIGTDNYYTNNVTDSYKTGIGLFNTLKQNDASGTNGLPSETSKKIDNFTLSGYISGKRTDESKDAVTLAKTANFYDICVGGLAPLTSSTCNIARVSFDNLNIDSSTNAGALFAKITNAQYVNNCSADKLKVTGHRHLGGLVGDANAALYVNTEDNASSQFKLNVHQLAAGNNNCATGGIVGGLQNNKSFIIKNTNIIGWNGEFNSTSTVKPYIGRKEDETLNDTTLGVGGVLGNYEALKVPNFILDNVHVYGVNLYGYHVGGMVGSDGDNQSKYSITNCGLHGKSNDVITIDDSLTYTIKAQESAGGIVGRSFFDLDFNTNTVVPSITIDGFTYDTQINGCSVNDYTIESIGPGAYCAGAGGIIGVSRNQKMLRNIQVKDCVLRINGKSERCAMGGVIGYLTKHEVNAYNVVVNHITFETNALQNNAYSMAAYGLFNGVGNNTSAAGSINIKVVGFTSIGENKISAAFGYRKNNKDYIQISAGERDVEFDCGRLASQNLTSNTIPIITKFYQSPSYIIYSDYDGASDKTDLTAGSTVGYYGKELSAVNGSNNAVSVSTTDNFPYVNSSPSVTLGNETLTGDGIWCSKTGDTLNLKADKIISDFNTNLPETGTKTYKAKTYANLTSNDIALYTALKTKISTYNTELDDDYIPTDIPVIVMDNPSGFTVDGTTYNWTDAIYAYIRVLTNSTEAFTSSSSDIYSVELKKCTYANGTLTAANNTTLERKTDGTISMTKNDYDSNVNGQFTLIDVQFKNPAVTSQIAYHLYIPVYTKALFDFKFDITALAGTSYLPGNYTNGRHFSNLETNRGNDAQNIVVENYGSPITMYLRYEYDINNIINNILGGGYGLNWNYEKTLNVVYNYTTNDNKKLPDDTKFVLVDVNQKDKVNYSDSFSPTADGDITINNALFPAYSFTEGSGTKYSVVTFADLLKKTGISFQATSITKAQAESATSTVFIEVNANDSDASQFSAAGLSSASKRLRNATKAEIEAGDNLYTVSAVKDNTIYTGSVYEDYYLTMISNKGIGDVRHQLTFTSKGTIESSGRIRAHCEANDEVVVMLADIFDKTLTDTVTTFIDEGSTPLMGRTSGNGKDYIDVQTKSTIKFALSGDQLAELISALDGRDVSVYANTHLHLKKTDSSGTKAIAVDGTSFTPLSASSAESTNYIYNNGIYVKLTNYEPTDPAESDVFMSYDGNGNPNGYYRRMNACGSGDLTGSRVVNFYELQYTSGGNEIDLRPYLTGEAALLTNNTAYEVVIISNFRMSFTPTGIDMQFPVRSIGTEGTLVNAQTAVAYSPDQTKYSDTKTRLGTDTNAYRYYTNPTSGAELSYNVLSDTALASGNLLAKTNDSLGINTWDEGTTNSSSLKTWAKYDVTNYPDRSITNETQIQWTLSLRRRESVNGEGEYGTDLPIGTYLKNVKLYGSGGILSANAIIGTEGSTKYVYTGTIDKFVDPNNDNFYIAYVTYDVATGDAFEAASAFYSNYKVILTARIVGKPTSETSDYIIYTNAKLNPAYYE